MGNTAKTILCMLMLVGGLIGFFCYENRSIVLTRFDLYFDKLPAEFEDFTIVHLSDFHNQHYGPGARAVIPFVERAKPDLIAFTGDLVDRRQFRGEPALELMRGLVRLAPVYYVNGNHEWGSGRYDQLEMQIRELGVRVLRNERKRVLRGNTEIAVLGIDDPVFRGNGPDVLFRELSAARSGLEPEVFTILLSHRPEAMKVYAQGAVDLVLSGHAHGGQVRLPLVGGLVAPNQGLFPKYSAGVYEMERTRMVVHRGLGNSIVPLRLFNRPEVIVIQLHRQQ